MTNEEFDAMSFRKGQRCSVRKQRSDIINRTDLAYSGKIVAVDFTSRFLKVVRDDIGGARNVNASRVELIE